MLQKLKRGLKILREDGLHRVIAILRQDYSIPLPQSRESQWKAGTISEINYWDHYFRTEGGNYEETYRLRFDPELPLQARPASLLARQSDRHILDVGAGPLTWLGKKLDNETVNITAVDPLADEYDRILSRYNIEPLVRTQKLAGEQLLEKFAADSFGLVFARNCIDHSLDPEDTIRQMIEVAKPGGYVLLEHHPNEAENENYEGLHQWNFSMSESGDFLISSKDNTVNMSQKYAAAGQFSSRLIREYGETEWLVVTIHKH